MLLLWRHPNVSGMRSRIVLLALSVSAFAGCRPAIEEDLDGFCRVVNEVAHDPNVAPPQQFERVLSRKDSYSKAIKDGTSDIFKKLPDVPLDERYTFLLDASKKAGQGDWRCSAFERMVATARAAEMAKKELAEEQARAEAAKAAAASASPTPSPAKTEVAAVSKKKTKKKRRH